MVWQSALYFNIPASRSSFPSLTHHSPLVFHTPFLWPFLSETHPEDGDWVTAMCLGHCARGSLDRPGPTFSKGVMSSISHELEQMMRKFSSILASQKHSLLHQMVTLSNTLNVLPAMLHNQTH